MKHVRRVERYKIKNVFKEYDEEEDDGGWDMKRGIKDERKRRIGNVGKEGEVFDLVKGVTEEYEIRHWFYEGKEKEGKCNCNCNCSCLNEMVLEIERVGFSIGKESNNNINQELHKNNDINEYDNEGSKWNSEYMKVDKSITCVNIERGISGNGNVNNSNYNGLNELHKTTMSLNNNTYRNHNTTMTNYYQRYSQLMSTSLIDSVNSKHNKLKSSKKMYQYDYEQQQQHQQHYQSKVMLTKNKSFNDLIKPYTMFERKTKASTLPVVPYVNNKSFHCGNIIYPISNVDYLKTEQMKRINTLLFTKHNNTLNLRKKYNQI